MSFAIIRGGNGRRHEVDFGDDPVRLDVSIGEATVQISVEATDDPGPSGGRRFATLAETPIMGLRFAGLERDRPEWRFLDATPYPDLSSGGEAAIPALEELLAP